MSKFNELLAALEEAFEAAEARAKELAEARAVAAKELAAEQSVLDLLKAEHDAVIDCALKSADDARVALDRARQAANDFSGNLLGTQADPRVSVR